MGVNLCHLWILFVKNARLQIRSPLWLVMELVPPVMLILYCVLLMGKGWYGESETPDFDQKPRVLWTMKDGCCARAEVETFISLLKSKMKLEYTPDYTEIKQEIMKPVEKYKNRIYGIRIEKLVAKKKLKYKILTGKAYLSSMSYDTFGPHLTFYGRGWDTQEVNHIQYWIDTTFQEPKSNTTPSLHYLPRPENIKLAGVQSSFYIYCPLMFILVIVYTTRNIVSERQTIQPYLSVMGLSTATFYLSHCIFAFVWICAFSLAHLFLIFSPVSNFPWSLGIVTMILFSLAATAYAAVMACLFTNSSTAIQATISLWLAMCFTPMMVSVSPTTPTWLACAQSLWPTYALHYIFKYAFTASDYGQGTWSQLANSLYTGQATIGPLLMLILYPFLMAGIICIFEKKLWRKIASLWARGRMNNEAEENLKLLSNPDEKFDVDEKDADIILKDVHKKYPNGVKAVKGLNMIALRGQVTALLGHNGAGKTTTFSMICGVEDATAGTVEVGGYPAGSSESRKTIGYCAQVNTLIDQMTVKDHLWLAHGLKRAEGNYWDEGEKLLETLGLDNLRVKKLSGGQKRKLCVAMALIGNSRVILLDEPTAGMDPESRRDVEKLLEEVKKERTILLTTHYMDEAETLGDRIFIMADGHGVCSGSPQFLKKRFGTGYVLTIVAADGTTGKQLAQQMEPVVRNYTTGAKVEEIRGKQVELAIPIDQQSHFPQLFEHIETNQKNLHISSFGLSLNSLEQVFLHVCSLTAKEESKREAPLEESLAALYEEPKYEGFTLYLQQFYAVFIKKFIYTIRFWSQLVTQIGVPLLAIIAAVLLYLFGGAGQTDLVVEIPPGREMFVQYSASSAKSDDVKNLEDMGAVTIPSGRDSLKSYLRNNLDQQFKLGMDFDAPANYQGVKVIQMLYNAIYPLAAAQAINALSQVRSPKCDITVSFDVFDNADTKNFMATYMQSVLLFFLISLTVCQLVVTIIEDRVSRFAHQQLLTGMKPTVYWLGEVAYCLMIYSIQAIIYLIALSFTGAFTPGAAIILLLMLLLYFWSIIPTVFVFSRFIKSSSKGALLLWVLLFGSFIGVFIYVYAVPAIDKTIRINAGEADIGQMNALELLLFLFRLLFPSYTVVELMATYINHSNGVVNQLLINPDPPETLITMHCICLAVTGAVSLLIFLLVQQRHIQYGIFQMCRARCGRNWIPEEAIIADDSCRNAPEGEAMLETVDMSKVYGKKCALAHLNMSVRTNEIFGLLGVSGAGKTTAFNILTGQMFATQGTATIDGIDCRKKVVLGFCPQFDAIHPLFTGREALTILARIHGYHDPKQTADRLLEIVKMTEHGRKQMGRCSGGQKRRISVAASLLTTKSHIIIMDEATAGIDPKARRDIWEVITAARNHAAILMTSHSMDECEALCNRIGILKQGGLAIVGTSQSLKSRYGNFYTLTMALPSSKMKPKVTEEVARWFPGSILKSDGFSLHLKWQLPKKPTDRWSTVFASCIRLSQKIGVADFCLTQSTLQDIFLLLAGHDPIPLKEANIQTPTKTKTTSKTRSSSAEQSRTPAAGSSETAENSPGAGISETAENSKPSSS